MAFKELEKFYKKNNNKFIIHLNNKCRFVFNIDYNWVKKHRVEKYFKKDLKVPVYNTRRTISHYSPEHKAIFIGRGLMTTNCTRNWKIRVLLHELRHFMQDQKEENFHKNYIVEKAKNNYQDNVYEIDAIKWAKKYNRFNHMVVTETDKRDVNYFKGFYKKFLTYHLVNIYQDQKNKEKLSKASKKSRQVKLIALYNILKNELKDDFKEMVLDQQMYFGSAKIGGGK